MAEKKMKKDRKGLYIFLGAIGGTAAVASLATGVAYAVQKNDTTKRNDAISRAYSIKWQAEDDLYREAIAKLESQVADLKAKMTEENKVESEAKIAEAEGKIRTALNKIKANEDKYKAAITWKVNKMSLKEVKDFNPTEEEVNNLVAEKAKEDEEAKAKEDKEKAEKELAQNVEKANELNKTLNEEKAGMKEDEFAKLSEDDKAIYAANDKLTEVLKSEEEKATKDPKIVEAYKAVVEKQKAKETKEKEAHDTKIDKIISGLEVTPEKSKEEK